MLLLIHRQTTKATKMKNQQVNLSIFNLQNTTTKTKTLLRDVVSKYHPEVKNNNTVKKFLSNNNDWINIERMVEETMAAVGGYNFVDGAGYDFDDGVALGCANSECKTASIYPNPIPSGNYNSYKLEISNVSKGGPYGGEKNGTLRVVLFNPITDTTHYYYIPKAHWKNMIVYHPTTQIGKIAATWNSVTGSINKLDKFEVKNFDALAKLPPNALDDIVI